MRDKDDAIWIVLIGLLLVFAGLYLAAYVTLTMQFGPQATIADIMAHWPQLTGAPSLDGIRGEVGGMQIPDHFDLGRLPKAGIAWPCTSGSESAQICYLNADFSRPAGHEGLDMAQDYQGKYIFITRKEVNP